MNEKPQYTIAYGFFIVVILFAAYAMVGIFA